MALGLTTIKIQRARIVQLQHEIGLLRRENARMRRVFEITGTELPRSTPDYGPGGHEWIDPVSGIDTWDGASGAD
jgi:hypothetical protein